MAFNAPVDRAHAGRQGAGQPELVRRGLFSMLGPLGTIGLVGRIRAQGIKVAGVKKRKPGLLSPVLMRSTKLRKEDGDFINWAALL